MENLETPRMLYQAGTQWELESGTFNLLVVKDADDLDQALANGWHLDQYAAKDANETALIAAAAAETAKADADKLAQAALADAPPTRDELKQKATELGISFHPNTGDEKLTALIAAATENLGV